MAGSRGCLDERTDVDDFAPRCTRREVEDDSRAIVEWAHKHYSWPGWTVLATDVYGLTWFPIDSPHGFGTFARHDACSTVAKVDHSRRPECPVCPTEPGSRTHRARANEPCLLYLVRYRQRWLKYGIGGYGRVAAHERAGARVVQVLAATHAECRAAEDELDRLYGDDVVGAVAGLPVSFGAGTEVVPARLGIDLRDVLPHGEVVADASMAAA